jgi:hypothetical protein
MKRAWNFIHAFLRENEVSGIYEEQSPEATIPNILQYTTHFVQVLLQEGELSREVLGEVNAELSSVYSIL